MKPDEGHLGNVGAPLRRAGLSGVSLGVTSAWLILATACQPPQAAWHTPPRVMSQTPFRLFKYITDLPSVAVEFSEPVLNVAAGDLTVNGSPATSVSGAGAGRYLFTGFVPPNLGPVNVVMAPGGITDLDGNPFPGGAWDHILIDAAADGDDDGLLDGDEVNIYLTDPTNPDTDGDGLPDGYEVAHACLDPLENEMKPLGYGEVLPRADDPDNDGVPNYEEYVRGTDPCAP